MLTLIFWSSVFGIVYAYFGYPISLYLLTKTSLKKEFNWSDGTVYNPFVSIIISACNEENKIKVKLDNTLELDYPVQKLEIIVASDASSDNTDKIVERYEHITEGKVLLVRLPKKGGKEAAQKAAVKIAKGEILVFTDTSTSLKPYVLRQIIGNFVDERVGGVDGMSKVLGESGESAYLKYENKIREWEAQLGSTVSFGGCLFAARKEILVDFATDLQSDFRTALQTVTHGKQAIIDRKAIAEFADTKDPSKEFNRKHRTIVRGINNLFHHLYLLNPFKYGLFSYQLFCHKLLKWLIPFFMIGAAISNLLLLFTSPIWIVMAFLQVLFYWLATAGWLEKEENILFRLMGFFLMSNMSILYAWYSYLKGERFVTWKVTER